MYRRWSIYAKYLHSTHTLSSTLGVFNPCTSEYYHLESIHIDFSRIKTHQNSKERKARKVQVALPYIKGLFYNTARIHPTATSLNIKIPCQGRCVQISIQDHLRREEMDILWSSIHWRGRQNFQGQGRRTLAARHHNIRGVTALTPTGETTTATVPIDRINESLVRLKEDWRKHYPYLHHDKGRHHLPHVWDSIPRSYSA